MQIAKVDIPETKRQEKYEMRKLRQQKEDMRQQKYDEENIATKTEVEDFLSQEDSDESHAEEKDDYIKVCRCYLGAAARAGFRSLKITLERKSCTEERPISVGTYASLCESDLAPKKCLGWWDITKS